MKTSINLRTIALLTLLVVCAFPAISQTGQGPRRPATEEDVRENVKNDAKILGLNEKQEKEIADFQVDLFKKNRAEMEKNGGDRDKMREFRQGQRQLRNQKYKEVLTEEQYNKYLQIQEERRQQWQQRQ